MGGSTTSSAERGEAVTEPSAGERGEPEEAALSLGLHLFVEKPVARDVETAEHISQLVAAADVVTAAGYHWRYLDTVDRARAVLDGQVPLMFVGVWLDQLPGTSWWPHVVQSGGQFVEQVTHLFDLARLLVGEVVDVHADGLHGESVDGVSRPGTSRTPSPQ